MSEGLRQKYFVFKEDGTPIAGQCFVLKPDTDISARLAIREYAESCSIENPALADDLREWVYGIEKREDEERIAMREDEEKRTFIVAAGTYPRDMRLIWNGNGFDVEEVANETDKPARANSCSCGLCAMGY